MLISSILFLFSNISFNVLISHFVVTVSDFSRRFLAIVFPCRAYTTFTVVLTSLSYPAYIRLSRLDCEFSQFKYNILLLQVIVF